MNQQTYTDTVQESLVQEMMQIEKLVEEQLSVLSKAMPEIYSGYANVIRETMDGVRRIIKLDDSSQNALNVAAEIAARCVESWGAWQTARKHNAMLAKLLTTKQQIASTNLQKIKYLIPKTRQLLTTTQNGFNAICHKEYMLASADDKTALAAASLCCRMLHIYRTNLFLKTLTEYLKKEYETWLRGEQTSDDEMPDYYAINEEILKSICSDKPFDELSSASESDGKLMGYQLMLLADPQLTAYILINEDGMYECNTKNAAPPVRAILYANKGLLTYKSYFSIINRFIEDNEMPFMSLTAFGAIIVLGWISFFFLDTSFWSQFLLFVSSGASVYKIFSTNRNKYQESYCHELVALAEEKESQVRIYCGKVELPEIDYQEKSGIKEAAKGFLGLQ